MTLTRHALADHGAAEVDIGVRGPKGERLCWYECTVQGGRKGSDIDMVQLATSVERLGAGELLVNCIDNDGQNAGYDLPLLLSIKAAPYLPHISPISPYTSIMPTPARLISSSKALKSSKAVPLPHRPSRTWWGLGLGLGSGSHGALPSYQPHHVAQIALGVITRERSAPAPQAQPHHVAQVAHVRGRRGGDVHDARVGQRLLDVEHHVARLGALASRARQVLGAVGLEM